MPRKVERVAGVREDREQVRERWAWVQEDLVEVLGDVVGAAAAGEAGAALADADGVHPIRWRRRIISAWSPCPASLTPSIWPRREL